MSTKYLNIPAIICSLIISIGCFMPWVIMMGFAISNNGFKNGDSIIVLCCGIISLLTAVSTRKYNGIHLGAGIIAAAVGFINYFDLNHRGLSAGPGLYMALAGALALTIIALVGISKRKGKTKTRK